MPILGRQVARPGTDQKFAAQANASLDVYNAQMEPPATAYVLASSPLMSNLAAPKSKVWTWAPFVSHRWRRNGHRFAWSWGGIDMYRFTGPPKSGPSSGQVNSTAFQKTLVQLHDWQTNDNWYICYPAATVMFGSEHNLGLSFRTQQLDTQITGGSWPARMTPRNRYTKVQRVPRYNSTPQAYQTKGARS